MSDQASKDEAAKLRVVSHMNADHHDSVVRYLEHYHGVPGYQAYDGKISDVSLDKMTFVCRNKSYTTPFKPAMTSFREARERVVQMDKECLQGLDRSDITVNEFKPPTGLYMVAFVIISTTFVAFSTRRTFEQGGVVFAITPRSFSRFCWNIQPLIFWFMLVAHTLETIHMARGRLRKHSLNMRSLVWWKWLGTTFIEGYGSYNRFDKMVEKKRAEKDKQKH